MDLGRFTAIDDMNNTFVKKFQSQRNRLISRLIGNRPRTHARIPIVVAAILVMANACVARDYLVDSQQAFDELKGATFEPGDVIQFQHGQRFEGMFAPSGSGAIDAPIRIEAIGSGPRPRIDAGGKHRAGVLLKNVDHWEVSGLEITNTDGSPDDQGDLFGVYVLLEGVDRVFRHIYLDDCHIHDINGLVAGKRRGGIHVHVTKCRAASVDDLRITNNRIVRIGGVGIGNDSSCARVAWSRRDRGAENLWTNVYVADNFIDRTGRNCIIARVSKDAVYERNVAANSSRYDTGHSIFCFNTDGIRIQHNEAYGNVGDESMDRGGFDADYNCINTYIQYNYSHDNMWFCGIMKRRNRNVVIRYNISQNERKGLYFYGFERERLAEDIHIYNNTHFTRKGLHVQVFPENRTPLNTRFENNVFYFEDEATWGKNASGINTTFQNNLYFNINPYPADESPVLANPLFENPGHAGTNVDLTTMKSLLGYRLQRGSPGINQARLLNVRSKELRDFFGKPVNPNSANLGAVQ